MKLVKEAGPLTLCLRQGYVLRSEARGRSHADSHALCRTWLCPGEHSRSGRRNQATSSHANAAVYPAAFPWGIPVPFSGKRLSTATTSRSSSRKTISIGLDEVKVTGNKQFNEAEIKACWVWFPAKSSMRNDFAKSFDNLKKLYGARGYINFTAVPVQDFDEAKKTREPQHQRRRRSPVLRQPDRVCGQYHDARQGHPTRDHGRRRPDLQFIALGHEPAASEPAGLFRRRSRRKMPK